MTATATAFPHPISSEWSYALRESRQRAHAFGVRALLTAPKGNPKTAKNETKGYLTSALHLSPVDRARTGVNLCPNASPGCARACLNTAGRAGIRRSGERRSGIERARDRRTRFFVRERDAFLVLLRNEIRLLRKAAARKGLRAAVRLNGTSDVAWERIAPEMFEEFPDVTFYDYTKDPMRALRANIARLLAPDPAETWPTNYQLVLSWAETEAAQNACRRHLRAGGRIAVPIAEPVPDTFLGAPVVDGDESDAWFLAPQGTVLRLAPKGRAKRDRSGFVVRTESGAAS